jgi:hypothetical protein
MTTITQALETLRAARNKTRQQLTRLDAAIRALQGLAGGNAVGQGQAAPKRRRTMSAAARRKIAAAQRARWAKVRKRKAAA